VISDLSAEDRKDILLAWAYKYIKEGTGIRCQDGVTRYPSHADEFMTIAASLIPDIEVIAENIHDHADIAAKE